MSDMERIERMFQHIDGNMKQMDGKLDALVQEIKDIKEDNVKLKEQVAKQEERLEKLEREIRRKNIVVKGITDNENESEAETAEKIYTVLHKIGPNIDMKVDIDEIRRIGNYKKEGKRPILVKLTKDSMRSTILNTKNLKGTEIWIDEDYPKNIQEERKLLIPQMKEARQRGYKAYIRYNKLIVNNEVAGGIKQYTRQGSGKNEEEKESTSHKRTANERSPEGDALEEQIRKITRTTNQKN